MNGVLLDSHVLIWLISDEKRVGDRARTIIGAASQVYFSAASIWELEIKRQLGKVEYPANFVAVLLESGLRELGVAARHAVGLASVELPHRDPFDRMLLSQARIENLTFVTADAVLLASVSDLVDARS